MGIDWEVIDHILRNTLELRKDCSMNQKTSCYVLDIYKYSISRTCLHIRTFLFNFVTNANKLYAKGFTSVKLPNQFRQLVHSKPLGELALREEYNENRKITENDGKWTVCPCVERVAQTIAFLLFTSFSNDFPMRSVTRFLLLSFIAFFRLEKENSIN